MSNRILAAALLLLVPIAAFAQAGASISGTVTDASGAVVPAARVTVSNEQTGAERAVSANESGYYTVGSLAPGRYAVTVEADGFQTSSRTGVEAQVDERLRVDVSLAVGQITEVVEVSGQAAKVNTQDAVMRSVIDAKRMVDLPLNGRSPLQLMALTPGVIPARADVGGSFQPDGQQFASVSGSKTNGVNYVLDGGDNMDTYRAVANSFPNPDILQEFSVQTNSYSAEFGGRAGGVVNAVTKSGTNQFHGTLFEFLRNQQLNAGNFFAPADPATGTKSNDGLKRNQYGGTIGGPIIRNKTFFFFGYQQTAVRQTPTTAQSRVLTAGQRMGDFSDLVSGSGSLIPINDPTTGAAFANNVIPSSRLDPVFQNFLDAVPTAPDPSGIVYYPRRTINDDTQWNLRVDHQFTTNDRLFVRLFRDLNSQPNTGIQGNILSYANRLEQDATNLTLGYTKIFSPSVLADFSATFNRSDGLRGDVAPFNWQDLGANVPAAGTSNDLLFFMNGFFNISLFGDTPLVRNNFQYKASFSTVKGRHNLRYGVTAIRRQFNIPIVNVQFHGRYTFSQALTGSNAADAVIGKPSAFLQTDGFRVALRETDWAAFINDEYKLNSRVTLNLGMRYEPFLPWRDTWNPLPQLAQFQPGQQSTVYNNAPTGLIFYGDQGVQRGVAKDNWKRFAPRMGVAIDPTGHGTMSFRAGYGVFFDQTLTAEQTQQYASQIPAFTTTVNVPFPVSTQDPYAGRPVPFPAAVPKPRDYVFPSPVTDIRMFSPDMTNPYTQQWNATFESQLFRPSLIGRVTYQGSKGTRLPLLWEQNPGVYVPGQSTRGNVNSRRPYGPDFTSIKSVSPVGNHTYNALVVTLEKRFTKTYSVLGSYTWSKNIDTGSNASSANGNSVVNPFNFFSDRGRADADRTHAVVVSYVWELPKLSNAPALVRHVLGGWQNNGIVSMYSGFPFSVVSGIDNSLTGVGQDRANLIGDPNLSFDRPNGQLIQKYFNTDAFTANPEGTFGTSGRNILRGPGTQTVDFSVFKNIPTFEGQSLQFRAEMFNFLNHANFGNPNSNLQSGAFGRITSAGSPRIIQFALKYVF
ncbi:MAG: TonB-dependent receptor plug domain-containing protein [Acidobacteria bacterium]|nr:TonB-dependent receptor plug domain-containing protein [Acidobacteriota bacterium]